MAEVVVPGFWVLEVEATVSGSNFKNSMAIGGVSSGAFTPPTRADSVVDGVITFLQDLYYNDVTIIQSTLRLAIQHKGTTVGMETPPVWTNAESLVGTGNTTWGGAHNANYLPKDVALFVKKGTSGGRSGKLFIRNVLTEVDVGSALSGEWTITEGAGHFTFAAFNAAVLASLGSFLSGPGDVGTFYLAVMHLMHVGATDGRTAFGTACTSLTAERPVWNKAQR